MADDAVAKVEVAFDDGPFVASPTWTDVTQYNTSGVVRMGRAYELDRFQPGTATLQLRTIGARLFDPEYTAGTYYGKLTPMRQVRITKTYNAVTYPIFRGFITDWGETVPARDNVFVTTIEAMDGLGALEKIQLPSSAWALVVAQDSPSLWFRLGESDTVRVTDSSAGGNYGIYDNVVQGAQGLVPNDADGAVDVGTNYDPGESRITIQNPALISGYPFTVTALFSLASDVIHARTLFAGAVDNTDGVPGLFIAVGYTSDNPDKLYARVLDGSTSRTVASTIQVADNLTHHAAVVFTSSSSFSLYVDGVNVGVESGGNPSFPGNPPNGYTIGNWTDVFFGAFGFRGIIDELCVWNGTALSSVTVAKHSLAGKTGWAGDDTGARVTRFLDAINWPASLRSIDTGISTLSASRWSTGETALSVLQNLADTEYGAFFAAPDGKLTWHSRHRRYLNTRATTSQATFGDTRSGTALKYVAEGFNLHRDEALLRNPVIASRVDGVTVSVSDATLIANTYGYNAWSAPPTQDALDATVRDRANWLLARYKNEASRLKSMTVIPKSNPTGLYPVALGLGIGDRITVKRQPLGIGNVISVDQWVEGVTHEFNPNIWKTTFTASPVEVETYLVLDTDRLSIQGQAFTVLASSDVFTLTPDALANATQMVLYNITGSTGVTTDTQYFVVSASGNTGKLSLTSGGAAINVTADGSGNFAQIQSGSGVDGTYSVVAATDVFTWNVTGGIANDTPVTLAGLTGAAGVSAGTTYYVVGASGPTFKLALTVGGAAINITTDGSGTISNTNTATLAY